MNRRDFIARLAVIPASAWSTAALTVDAGAVTRVRKQIGIRVSIRKDDPGERTFAEIWADGKKGVVYLDGVRQKHAITADEREGMVVRLMTDDRGRVLVNPVEGRALEETVFGDVEIRIVERA